MAFKLNEAPESVLSALDEHAFKRGCCTVTAILCCLPTLGFSTGGECGDGNDGCCNSHGSGCCYMGCLDESQEGSLTGLKDGLERIIKAANRRVKEGEDSATVSLEQVQQTINLLKRITISGSYQKLLNNMVRQLNNRVDIYTETTRLLGDGESQRRIVREPPRQQVTIFSASRGEPVASAPPQSEEKANLLVNEEDRSHSHGAVPPASAPPAYEEHQQFMK